MLVLPQWGRPFCVPVCLYTSPPHFPTFSTLLLQNSMDHKWNSIMGGRSSEQKKKDGRKSLVLLVYIYL